MKSKLEIRAPEEVISIKSTFSFFLGPHLLDFSCVTQRMLPLNSAVSPISRLTVLHVRLIMGVHTLLGPRVIRLFSIPLQVLWGDTSTDHSDRQEVAIVHKNETTGEVVPGKTHCLAIYNYKNINLFMVEGGDNGNYGQ